MLKPPFRILVIHLLTLVGWAAPHTSWAYDQGPQCVPFARALSSISLFGDAWHWWSAAAGRYDRGLKPQAGSVLSFRPDARMPLGHDRSQTPDGWTYAITRVGQVGGFNSASADG